MSVIQELMIRNYQSLQQARNTPMRHYYLHKMVSMYEEHFAELNPLWEYCPTCVTIRNRFKLRNSTTQADIPAGGGIYCLGQTNYSPETGEVNYYIKIGQAADFDKRMKQYKTHNPFFWKIAFLGVEDPTIRNYAEHVFHAALQYSVSLNKSHKNGYEWFEVSKSDYIRICNEGFKSSLFTVCGHTCNDIPKLKALF